MPTDAVFSLGGVRIGFSGRVPPLSDGSFLPQFRAEGAPDVTLELYQDADAHQRFSLRNNERDLSDPVRRPGL